MNKIKEEVLHGKNTGIIPQNAKLQQYACTNRSSNALWALASITNWGQVYHCRAITDAITIVGEDINISNSATMPPCSKLSTIPNTTSGTPKRNRKALQFLELIKLLNAQTSQTIYLAGGISEVSVGNYLMKNLKAWTITNLINQISLRQLIDLIGNATIIISNETCAIHIAAATQTNAVCILGGGHICRFAPYPEYMISKPVCVYEKMECYYCNRNYKFTTWLTEPYPCVANVSWAAVWESVQPFL
jgi:hypothetical protein